MNCLSRWLAAALLSIAVSHPAPSQGLVEYALILTMVCNNCDVGNGTLTDKVILETCATRIGTDAIKVGFIYKPARTSPDYPVEKFDISFEGRERDTTACKYYDPPDGPGYLAVLFRGPPGLGGDMNGDGIDDIGLVVPSGIAKKIGAAVQVSTVNPADGSRTTVPVNRVFFRYHQFH